MSIISVQSHVSFGHVGNSAAVFALQTMGLEVLPVHTVLLAHHPGHGGFHGAPSAPETVAAVFDGLREIGAYQTCTALLTGYMGSVETGECVLSAWWRIRRDAPSPIFCCAPVIGDRDEGIYVEEGLVEYFRVRAVPAADVVIANAFEAGMLSGVDVGDLASARQAGGRLIELGAGLAIISSVPMADDRIGNVLVGDDGAWVAGTRRQPVIAKGAGDFMAAVWLGRYLETRDPLSALGFAVGATEVVVKGARHDPDRELPVVLLAKQWSRVEKTITAEKLY